MNRFSKGLETLTNVAVLVVCCLLATVLVRTFFFGKPPVSPPQSSVRGPVVGAKLELPGYTSGSDQKTLVLALSTQCHFCAESTPFYRELTRKAFAKRDRVLAVLPQPVAESRTYLDQNGVLASEIRQDSLDRIQVSGTPTLVLADKDGKILKVWVGKLPRDQENDVISNL